MFSIKAAAPGAAELFFVIIHRKKTIKWKTTKTDATAELQHPLTITTAATPIQTVTATVTVADAIVIADAVKQYGAGLIPALY